MTSQGCDDGPADSAYIAGTTRRLGTTDRARLEEDITPDEVRAGIRSMARHKAPGPDQLSNDFYLDYVQVLADPLARLFQRCWERGEYPGGHRQATIFAVAKGATTPDPLQYRPLAMLYSDYKILAKILASRL